MYLYFETMFIFIFCYVVLSVIIFEKRFKISNAFRVADKQIVGFLYFILLQNIYYYRNFQVWVIGRDVAYFISWLK